MRSLSLVADLAAIGLVACSSRLLDLPKRGDAIALGAALLLAAHGDMVNRAADARPYALMTLFVTVAMFASLRLIKRLGDNRAGRSTPVLADLALLSVAGGLILWLHNTGFFICLGLWSGLAVAVIMVRPPNMFGSLAGIVASGLGALIIWSPALPIFLEQGRAMAAMPFWTQAKAADAFAVLPLISGGGFAVAPVVVGMALGFRRLWAIDRPVAIFAATTLFLPLALVLATHFIAKPIFIDRLFAWMTPACLVVAAIGLADLAARRRGLAIATVLLIVLSNAATILGGKPVKEPWREIVATIARESRPGDRIVASPNEVFAPFAFYAPGQTDLPPSSLRRGRFQCGMRRAATSPISALRRSRPRMLPRCKRRLTEPIASG
ncbi:hypothetical protein [Rhizobium sp. G21]|uniref:hypothetical protein n=1 Tax=Rhizobium sp. G21 TaxID=2758439 RepID=UPI001602A4B3|nr:hypothetical protein [Rhizobium sp. G21]MBB1248141.1 hypothetical protein [Rhizobium sp. G21]